MKLLTRYLFKDILQYFVMFVVILVVILLVNQIYGAREDLLQKNPAVLDVVLYLVYGIPDLLAQTLPMICLMSTIFAYGLLAKNKEILAMVAAGVSFRRLAVPAVSFGVVLTLFMFWFTEAVVPVCQSKARYIEKVIIEGKDASIFTKNKNLFVKGAGDRFYYMKNYDSDRREMLFPILLIGSADGSGISQRIEADRGRLLPNAEGRKSTWEFNGAERWIFNPDGTIRNYEKFKGPYQIEMEEKLNKFLSKTKKPEEMNFNELHEYVDLLRKKGDKNTQSFDTALQIKLAFPVACLLMALLGYGVVADVHARHFARGVFFGLLIAIAFYGINTILKKLGNNGTIAPALAGWLPVAIFTVVDLLLLRNLNRVRG